MLFICFLDTVFTLVNFQCQQMLEYSNSEVVNSAEICMSLETGGSHTGAVED
jgi:hypothetical protein